MLGATHAVSATFPAPLATSRRGCDLPPFLVPLPPDTFSDPHDTCLFSRSELRFPPSRASGCFAQPSAFAHMSLQTALLSTSGRSRATSERGRSNSGSPYELS